MRCTPQSHRELGRAHGRLVVFPGSSPKEGGQDGRGPVLMAFSFWYFATGNCAARASQANVHLTCRRTAELQGTALAEKARPVSVNNVSNGPG